MRGDLDVLVLVRRIVSITCSGRTGASRHPRSSLLSELVPRDNGSSGALKNAMNAM